MSFTSCSGMALFSTWNSSVELSVAKLDPSKMAVYAIARPNAYSEMSNIIVSSEDIHLNVVAMLE